MKTVTSLCLVVTCLCSTKCCLGDPAADTPITVRVASYNVVFGSMTTPEQLGEMFKPYHLDIIGFSEVPDGDWTARVGKVLGMEHSYVGTISSANHKDKYKSILSRTPLEGTAEHELAVKRRGFWNPASVVRAATEIEGVSIAFYSLHISGSGGRKGNGQAYQFATTIVPKETTKRVIVVGDFNNRIGDEAMNTIEAAGLKPIWKDLTIDLSKESTFLHNKPDRHLGVIDHIFYNTSSGAKANEGEIIELKKPLSDHKPIWAEIIFPRKLKNVKKLGERDTTKPEAAALHVAPKGTAGPLVGAVDPDRVTLWMLARGGSHCSYTYKSADPAQPDNGGQFTAVPNPAANVLGRPFKTVIEGLSPNTRYRYAVTVDGKADPAWAGSFKTSPAAGKPAAFRLALTSCMKIGQRQTSWPLLLDQQPDIHVTVGDTHYADTTDPIVQLNHHVAYRRTPEFATVIRNIPTYAMWDDHDYGPNNSDGTAVGKEHSLAGWKQFWANPTLGTPETPGAFFTFSYGDVDFFMVDSRYHRSPNVAPDDEQKRMLGDAQFTWLLNGLKKSQARFKIIVSGSTLDHSKVDGWRIYTFSRHRLFDAINEHQVSGVMYMSGDIHESLVWEHHESDRVGYPLVEIISSGVANSKTRSFATVDFDTTREDPTARVRIVYGNGTVHTDKTWQLSKLVPPKIASP